MVHTVQPITTDDIVILLNLLSQVVIFAIVSIISGSLKAAYQFATRHERFKIIRILISGVIIGVACTFLWQAYADKVSLYMSIGIAFVLGLFGIELLAFIFDSQYPKLFAKRLLTVFSGNDIAAAALEATKDLEEENKKKEKKKDKENKVEGNEEDDNGAVG